MQRPGKYKNCAYSNMYFSLTIHQCLQMNLQHLEEDITTLSYSHKEKKTISSDSTNQTVWTIFEHT